MPYFFKPWVRVLFPLIRGREKWTYSWQINRLWCCSWPIANLSSSTTSGFLFLKVSQMWLFFTRYGVGETGMRISALVYTISTFLSSISSPSQALGCFLASDVTEILWREVWNIWMPCSLSHVRCRQRSKQQIQPLWSVLDFSWIVIHFKMYYKKKNVLQNISSMRKVWRKVYQISLYLPSKWQNFVISISDLSIYPSNRYYNLLYICIQYIG